jgi:L-glyceraldehyde 3-phosphate reductase
LVTSVLIGASKKEQVMENAKIIEKLDFSDQELKAIDEITL